jgi:PAS domain S-box-containing protein
MTTKILSVPLSQTLDLSGNGLALVEHAPLPMVMVEGAGHTVRQVNAAGCRLLGKSAEELIGKSFGDLLPEQAHWVEGLDRVYRTGQPETRTEEQVFTRPTEYWTYTMWPVIAPGQTAGVMIQVTVTTRQERQMVAMNEALVLGSVHQHELTEASEKLNGQLREEIAERTKMQQALAEKARLLDLSNDAILVLDLEHRIQFWNHGAEELYGWSREEALGKVSHALLNTKSIKPFEQISEELFRNGDWTGVFAHTKRDGRCISVLVRKVLDRDNQGHAVAILESMTDITERLKAVEALREARARLAEHAGQLEGLVAERTAELTATNQQLEAFVNSIAHDLRAPLRAMQGFSALVLGDAGTALSEGSRDLVGRIDQSAQFMDAMLSDLLAFSRISEQQLELTAVSLEPVIGSVLARLQKAIQEVNACVECSGPWPEVRAHKGTLIQVLFNLTSNALKFVRPGVPPQLRLRAEETAGFIRVWVEDNGVGIAPDYQEQIFRLFIRLDRGKFPGTGAGLAIVRKGVERMGGGVGVESAPGQGSRFWIELAKAAPAASKPL